MSTRNPSVGLAAIAILASAAMPAPIWSQPGLPSFAAAVVACVIFILIFQTQRSGVEFAALSLAVTTGFVFMTLLIQGGSGVHSSSWFIVLATYLLLWRQMELLSRREDLWRGLGAPALFGVAVLSFWQIAVAALHVSPVLLPAPSSIARAVVANLPMLVNDFGQTVLTAALRGYAIGCVCGFLVGLLCDRSRWLRKAILPYAVLMSAIPMIGVAPIAVMWFGFGWESKAAVVAIVTFFPMFINCLEGVKASEKISRDLMWSYAASHSTTLLKLRLIEALPFLFNALKINSTLAIVTAIVAEFFGAPVLGMGFRISTEVARMNLDIVWATIVVGALAGSVAYGGLSLIERSVTAWHPSFQKR